MKLTLFFTEGVSLKTWNQVGMFDREVALYRALQMKGIEISFVTYGDETDLEFAPLLPGIDLRVNDKKLSNWDYQRALQDTPPLGDIFKSNQMAGADVAMRAALKTGKKFVARCGYLLSEFQEQRYGNRSKEAKTARNLESEVFSGADSIVVTTEAMASSVGKRYPGPAERIHIIPNYVETDRFIPVKRVPNTRFRIGFVGRLDKQKNLVSFVRALIDLDIEVWLIGYGPQRAELERMTLGSRAAFRFVGNVPNGELPGLLNQCDLFVLPSLYEGHPKALLEAMACGLPVIGTRVAGTREVISDGENGILCETDSTSIRNAVESLMGDSELRGKLGEAARSYIQANCALDHIVALEINMLQALNRVHA